MGLYETEPAMNSAEFKCLREYMGFTTKFLAMKWDVSEYSIQRWERNRDVPPNIAHWLRDCLRKFDRAVDNAIRGSDLDEPLLVPRTDDESVNIIPAAVYRRIGMIASRETGSRIEYTHEQA